MEKKFLLFAGDTYYPRGGCNDLVGSFESIDDAKDYLIEYHYDWFHLVDNDTLMMVLTNK